MRQYDISEIAAMLAKRVEDVCRWLLPNGKKQGSEWRAGSVYGDEGQSLGVNLYGKAGVWRDFADEAKGGDLIDLIEAVKGIGKADAVKEAKDFLGIVDDMPKFEPRHKPFKKAEKPRGLTAPGEEMLRWFEGRGISQDTLRAFKVGQIQGKEGPIIVFPYLHGAELTFTKYRPLHNKHGMWTSKDCQPCLFGWQAMPENARTCVIVEGELDALALYEGGIVALSVPRGGGDGDKQDGWIDAEWDRLQLFDSIFLALDGDEQGQKAASHISKRLGQHRCFMVSFGPHKDANDALLAGYDLQEAFRNARTIDPPELCPASAYLNEVFDYYENEESRKGDPLPWMKTHDRLGLRDGETTIWAGINGHGKSQIAGHVVVNSLYMGRKWCIASMEFPPKKLLSRLCRQITGDNKPDRKEDIVPLDNYMSGQLWVFNVQGTAKAERILEVFEYAYRRYGVSNFLIDSLAKCGFADDDYNGQKQFVDKLSDFARNNNIQVHLVCHSRKRNDESDIPDKFDVKGSGGITDMVDNVYIVWRNKPKEQKIQNSHDDFTRKQLMRDEPDAILNCCKQREGEWEGLIRLWYDKASLQYLEAWDARPLRYCE